MYLSRTDSLLDIALYLLLSAGWFIGGWLLVTYSFRLHFTERIVAGLGAGFLLFISLSNLAAHVLPLIAAFWSASLVILLAGLLLAWRSRFRDLLDRPPHQALPALAVLLLLTFFFTLILKGEAIFDEYLHLPLISIMAAGDIPPHFYLNPDFFFAYHYGIHVFAASLVRLADFFPWSAWDISRAFALAFTLLLGWVWLHRLTRSKLTAWLGTLLITFGGGTRWLLLLLPASWLKWVSSSVSLVGSGLDTAPTLAAALRLPWRIEGGGAVSFPFAFHNGIFVPVFFNLGSTGAMPYMTVLLLLLLIPRKRISTAGAVIWSFLFSTLALSAEHLFVVIWVGIALALLIAYLLDRRLKSPLPAALFTQWGLILGFSALLSAVQGGFITETLRNLLASLSGSAAQSLNARGFSIRWPPGLLSAHLGELSITNPGQLVALLAELGPALLLVPLLFIRFKKELARQDILTAGLAISVPISLIFPLFFRYEVDRSITRMPATALWTCLVLGIPLLWSAFPHLQPGLRLGTAIGFACLILAGGVIFRAQLNAIPKFEYSYYIEKLDASFAADYWDKLPPHSEVLDPIQERSVTIFGRIARASSGIYTPLPSWQALIAKPDPQVIAAAGFDYIYLDRAWWDSLTGAQQVDLLQPCIDILDERKTSGGGDYRLLIDVSACR